MSCRSSFDASRFVLRRTANTSSVSGLSCSSLPKSICLCSMYSDPERRTSHIPADLIQYKEGQARQGSPMVVISRLLSGRISDLVHVPLLTRQIVVRWTFRLLPVGNPQRFL